MIQDRFMMGGEHLFFFSSVFSFFRYKRHFSPHQPACLKAKAKP